MNRASVGTIRRPNYLSIIRTKICNQQQSAFLSDRVELAVAAKRKFNLLQIENKTDYINSISTSIILYFQRHRAFPGKENVINCSAIECSNDRRI